MSRFAPFATCLLFALLATAATGVTAQVYEWRDARGNTTYGDRPPPGIEARPVGGMASSAAPPPADDIAIPGPANDIGERVEAMRKLREAGQQERVAAEREREQEKQRAHQCEQARNQLAALESGQRVTRFATGGERVVLDDDARADDAARTQDFITRHCE